MLSFESTSVTGKKMHSNSMFIKDRTGSVVGLLCINFDSSRYEALSKQVMDLCSVVLTPSVPSGTSLIVDQNDPSESAREQGFPTSIAGATASIVSSVVAYFLLNFANAYLTVSEASLFSNVTTVVSVLAGVVLLKEPFGLWQIVGVAVILVCVYAANATGKK